MRIVLLSDIHANCCALEAVLNDVDADIKTFWVLGDTVGYGPHPLECLEFLQKEVCARGWVMGNHDAGFAHILSLASQDAFFNLTAQGALVKHVDALDQKPLLKRWVLGEFVHERLRPLTRTIGKTSYVLTHASLLADDGAMRSSRAALHSIPARVAKLLRDKSKSRWTGYAFQYLSPWNLPAFELEFPRLRRRWEKTSSQQMGMLVGHSHIPFLYIADPVNGKEKITHVEIRYDDPIELSSRLFILNPGSVGQPRDLDNRAAYAILDTRNRMVEFRRVAYDVAAVQRDLQSRAYPEKLIPRLHLADLDDNCQDRWWREHFRSRALQTRPARPSAQRRVRLCQGGEGSDFVSQLWIPRANK